MTPFHGCEWCAVDSLMTARELIFKKVDLDAGVTGYELDTMLMVLTMETNRMTPRTFYLRP